MANLYINKVSYGLSEPLITEAPRPIKANRPPTTADTGYMVGQLWIHPAAQNAYILVLLGNRSAVWQLLEASGGAGVFSSLVVVGATTLQGTTLINSTGSGATTIGTGGTGAVNIGNATGNTAVTGALVATGALRGATVYASGDLGGVASNNALSNVSVAVAGGSGAFTITSTTGSGTATNAGFIKMYVGATAVFIPYYTATT